MLREKGLRGILELSSVVSVFAADGMPDEDRDDGTWISTVQILSLRGRTVPIYLIC
jgi:hypothetical protein